MNTKILADKKNIWQQNKPKSWNYRQAKNYTKSNKKIYELRHIKRIHITSSRRDLSKCVAQKFTTWKFAHEYTLISCIFMGFLFFSKRHVPVFFSRLPRLFSQCSEAHIFSVDKEITKATTEGAFFRQCRDSPKFDMQINGSSSRYYLQVRPLDRVTTVPKTCQRRMWKYSWRTYWLPILSGKKVARRLFTLDRPYFFGQYSQIET